MLMNLSSSLFTMTMIMGTFLAVSSSSWLGAWMGMEMNLMSFIPIINAKKTPFESESSMKYFIVQTIASIMLLSVVCLNQIQPMTPIEEMPSIMAVSLMIKMGAAPFHMWFPSVMQGMTWSKCFILMTWQKIAPMILVTYITISKYMINTIMLMSVVVGAMGGLNQTSLRKMMAYSSISHIGWMLASMSMSIFFWNMYFIIYTTLNIVMTMIFNKYNLYQISQIYNQTGKSTSIYMVMFISMLSLGGLPPFLGFLPKWVIIQNMINSSQYTTMLIMVMTTLMTLFFYLRMTFSAFMFTSHSSKWNNINKKESINMLLLGVSLMGIPIIIMTSIM